MTRLAQRRFATRSGWFALVVTVLARSALTIMVSLLGWSLAPAALGWHTTVVMTGSMLPKLVPGDLVVSRPVDPAKLSIGQVLLVDNPDHEGQLRLHRFVRLASDGRLILRGDANRTDDSSPVATSAVHGVAALHIPRLGMPVIWVGQRQFVPLLLTALALLALLRCAFWWRPATADHDAGADDDDESSAVPAEPELALAGPVGLTESPPATAPAPTPAPTRGLLRRALILGATALVLVAMAAGNADAAPFKFSGSATNSSDSWTASTFFTCANAVKATTSTFALPLGESSGTTAADTSGNSNTGTYSGGITYGVTGPCTHDSKTAVTLNGTTGKVAVSSVPTGSTVSIEVWFKAASSTHGGILMSAATNGSQTKLAMAMTASGTVTAANATATASATTTATYNDNNWHLAVMTIGTSGLALYVDNQPAVTNSMVTSVANSVKNTTVGFGDHTALSTGTFDYFQGSVGFAAAYPSVLTATQVAAHYAAAN